MGDSSGVGAELASRDAVSGPDALPHLVAHSHVDFRPLSIRQDGDGFMVGDLARGEFIEVPAVAVVVIDALRSGRTIAGAADLARDRVGEDVDVADFVAALRDLGFVARIDGVPLQAGGPELGDGGRLGAVLVRLARPLYSAPAWVAYGLLFAGGLVLLTVVPWFRPRYGQFFFLSNPVLSVALLTIIAMPLVMLHELAHWLGARIEGVPARITVSRRYYLLVLQTDLSALWALPRRRRYGPLLAGMAFDTVITAALLGTRAAQFEGWWHPAPALSRLLAALVLAQVLSISFQFVLFLRTDLYAVLITSLGCLNLTTVSRLRMAGLYRRLTAAEEQELVVASPRDRAVSRWWGWVQLAGAGLVTFYFAVFFAPAAIQLAHWIVAGLARSSVVTAGFWYILASGCVAVLPIVIPPITYLRDHRKRLLALVPRLRKA